MAGYIAFNITNFKIILNLLALYDICYLKRLNMPLKHSLHLVKM